MPPTGAGISHRDLKPGNILVDERGDVALADFGIAVVEDAAASSQTRTALSPEHAAPERLAVPAGGPPPEHLGDQFSLASTLYMLLTGKPPFGLVAELGLHEVLRRIVEAPAPPTGRDDVPAALEAALARALAKQPDSRYPSAASFTDALLATGVAPADPPVPPAPIGARDGTRAPAAGGFAGPVPYHRVTPTPPQGPVPPSAPAAGADWSAPAPGAHWSTPRMAPTPPPVLSPEMEPVARSWPGAGGPGAPTIVPGRGGAPPAAPPGASAPTVAPGRPPAPGPGPGYAPGDAAGYPPPGSSWSGADPHAVDVPSAGGAEPPYGARDALTLVPEHRGVVLPRSAGPPGGEPGLSRGRRVALVVAAAGVVVAGFVVLGVVLRSRSAPEPVGAPTDEPAPGDSVPGGPPAAPGPPRIESIRAVPGGGMLVFWEDKGAEGAVGYAYQVSVDGKPTQTTGAGLQPDGSPRRPQEIVTVSQGGKQQRIDVNAHRYCVVFRRLGQEGPVDSEPMCEELPSG